MDWLRSFVDLVLHLDVHLAQIVSQYGVYVYGILFTVIFAETGFVATPFLPGDSLLFAAGAIAATGGMNPHLLFLVLALAAILGDNVNYWIGRWIGPKVFAREKSWLLNPEHLQRTHDFYEKHGGKTIVIAKFMPIIRTFAPFVAGIGKMTYPVFLMFNISGGIFWVSSLLYAGYFFGNMPIVKNHFSFVIMTIIFVSLLPAITEFIKHSRAAGQSAVAGNAANTSEKKV
ncbi:MAG: DedA family protein [Candidatus Riflebacteria bacterium]|nr:DedA family protein [Candidatus Riflebacteria bacterium]